MMLLWFVACSDWKLRNVGDGVVPPDDTDVAGDTDIDDSDSDSDADTDPNQDTGDCDTATPVETSWVVGVPGSDPDSTGPVCTDVGAVDFTLATKWSIALDAYGGFAMNPVVAPNHGASWSSIFVDIGEQMVEIDGRDGSIVQAVDLSGYGYEDDGSTPAVGDMDGDGGLEFVRTDNMMLEVVDGKGAITAFTNPWTHYPDFDDEVAALADVDLDGDFEIVIPTGVFEPDGTAVTNLVGTGALESTGIFVADLDGDDWPEVVSGGGVWNPITGAGYPWDAAASPNYSFYGAPVDEGATAGVVFTTGRDQVDEGAPDGTLSWASSAYGDRTLASSGDATGDGVPDVCEADAATDTLHLVDADGVDQMSWNLGSDALYAGGCAMADLDADGVYEVLYVGLTGLFVLDGRTGDVLAQDPALYTVARDAAPVIADVDGDGSAEIVLLTTTESSHVATTQLTVLGPAIGRWARTRPVWNQLPYDITSIRDDGSLVSHPSHGWKVYDAFRAQPSQDGAHADLMVQAQARAASDECAQDEEILDIDLRNVGSVDAVAGAHLRVYGFDGASLVTVAEETVADPIPAGQRVLATLTVDPSQLGSAWVVEVTSANGDDCDRVDDRAEGTL